MATAKRAKRPASSKQWSQAIPRELSEASREVAAATRTLALASDRWFVLALGSAATGARRLGDTFSSLVEQGSSRLGTRWFRRESSRERLRRLIVAEAKRMKLEADGEALAAFSERIATLLELVFSGAVRIEDIAFEAETPAGSSTVSEADPEHEAAGPEPEAAAAHSADSVETGEQVPEREQGDEREVEKPLNVKQRPGVA